MALKPGPKRTATSTGKVEKTVTKHKYNSGSTVLTTTETFTYSPQDKLLVHKHWICK